MAKGRMLDNSISTSRKVNKLSLRSALIYTWGFSHTDDWGCISSDPEVIKAVVFPMKKEVRVSDIIQFIIDAQEVDKQGESLITEYQDCIFFNAFDEHQKLSPEKRAKPRFQRIPKNPQESSGEIRNPQENPIQDKRSEDKRSEDNTSGAPAAGPDPINPIINQFQEINPNFERLFRNKTQRGAAERMLKKLGVEKLGQIIAVLPFSNKDQYGPTITTPLQLEDKMGQLMAWYEKKQNKKVGSSVSTY